MKKQKGKTLSLTVFERLLIRNIVPQMTEWNFGSMKAAREVLESLFDEEEERKLQITIGEDGKKVQWKTTEDDGTPIPQEKELEFTDGLRDKIARFLKQLSEADPPRLGWEHYSLYEKFVES